MHTARRQHGAGLTVQVYTEGRRFAAGLQRALTVQCTLEEEDLVWNGSN